MALTGDAVAAGYTGLRVAADATLIVTDADAREAFVRYEHLIDRAMVEVPFTAMCGYDRSRLTPGAVNELASVHPHRRSGSSTFALFNGDRGLLLTGDVDAAVDPTFAASVDPVVDTIDGDTIDIDCSSSTSSTPVGSRCSTRRPPRPVSSSASNILRPSTRATDRAARSPVGL